MERIHCLLLLVGLFQLLFVLKGNGKIYLSNVDDQCLYCLLTMQSEGNLSIGCTHQRYCGPYQMARIFWADAGRLTIPGDEEVDERSDQDTQKRAFERCANDLQCSTATMFNYIMKYGKDCNNDTVTDCEDFMMIILNGPFDCKQDLKRTKLGTTKMKRFKTCDPKIYKKYNPQQSCLT